MKKTIHVIAPPGLKCPMPHRRGEFYTDQAAAEVPDDIDHRRLVADGSLLIVKEETHDPV